MTHFFSGGPYGRARPGPGRDEEEVGQMAEAIVRTAETVVVGAAQRPGTEPPYADGYDVQRRGVRVCAAVVDGAGHRPEVVRYAAIAPAVVTHTGMVAGGLAGLVTAGLCRVHGGDPQALAEALVAAAEEDGEGYRDDATVIALLRRTS